ncbi:hypothetical protein QBC38DRAFT_460884 [Podospora fimiseda]|uniref:NACHT domain-containing protein n=1 Tax=Podospora fimiseda TaxID=252190 RepID=A0AAN6YMR2_9PEZI|nr:hypothetical protein QBC38DRAFT_460884 [Podospora fimiseda]
MASRLIELSCQRFRQSIDVSDDRELQKLSLDDVRQGVLDIQRELRAKQCLRNLDRLTPYLDAADRYSKAVSHLCNGVPFMPYIWAPLMVILQSVRHQTHALDKILSAYSQIGNALPRLARYKDAFRGNHDFEHLLAFLFQDITEFHTKALALIRKPAWKIFFVSSWGRFESRFGAILDSINKTSTLIDQEASSLNIVDMKEWRTELLEKAEVAEKRWQSEQFQALMKWLETSDKEHQSRYDWLRDRACEGTGGWIMNHTKFRAWLRQGNSPTGILWMNGKPGSGKSVLCSQVVKFLQMDKKKHVLFIFGTRQIHLSAYDIQTHILQAIVAQVIRLNNDMVPLLYDQYLAKARPSSAAVLRRFLAEILPDFEEIRLVVDGVDELPTSEHKKIIKDLLELAKTSNGTLKLLFSSQDLPSIRPWLEKKPALALSHEQKLIMCDIELLVESSMEDLDESFGGALPDQLKKDLTMGILAKANGMILWVHLVFSLLRFSTNIQELRACIKGVPPDLKTLYGQILNNITARCSPVQLLRVKRIFGWLIFSKDGIRTKKTDVLIGSTICPGTEELNRDSRPFPTSLDVCKPLIEDGPHGTVTIVHSTVTEHLLSTDSGPFINQSEAQHSLAYACVCQISRNLDLAMAADHKKNLLDVCLGLFGLFDYANEYWELHLKDALHLGHSTQPTAVPEHQATLIQQINRLFQKYSSATPVLGPTRTLPEILLQLDGPEGRVSISNPERTVQIPDLLTMVVQVQTMTNTATQVVEYTTTQARLESDPSPLETAEARYRDLVRQILQQPNQALLPAEEVMTFGQQYATSAYLCHHRGCGRRRFGFSTSDELQDHIVTGHSKGFKCYQESCGYNDVGFHSKASLQAHVRKYHARPTVRALPKSIRRGNTPSIPRQQVDRPASNPRAKIEPPSTALRSGSAAAVMQAQSPRATVSYWEIYGRPRNVPIYAGEQSIGNASAADTITNTTGLEGTLQPVQAKEKTTSPPLESLGSSHEDCWSEVWRLESQNKKRLLFAGNEQMNNSPTGQPEVDDHMPSTESQNFLGQKEQSDWYQYPSINFPGEPEAYLHDGHEQHDVEEIHTGRVQGWPRGDKRPMLETGNQQPPLKRSKENEFSQRQGQDYHMQLMTVKEQNIARLMMAREDGEPSLEQNNNNPLSQHTLQDYQMQLMLLEQQKKKSPMMVPPKWTYVNNTFTQTQQSELGLQSTGSNHALSEHQAQLMILEQQNKKRLMKPERTYENKTFSQTQQSEPRLQSTGSNHALQDYEMQKMLLELQNKKRMTMARLDEDRKVEQENKARLTSSGGGATGLGQESGNQDPKRRENRTVGYDRRPLDLEDWKFSSEEARRSFQAAQEADRKRLREAQEADWKRVQEARGADHGMISMNHDTPHNIYDVRPRERSSNDSYGFPGHFNGSAENPYMRREGSSAQSKSAQLQGGSTAFSPGPNNSASAYERSSIEDQQWGSLA